MGPLGAALPRRVVSCNEPDPDSDSSPIPSSKKPGSTSSSHCTARGVQNEGMGESQIAPCGEFCRSDGVLK